jgi:multiple sugar transport system substrate-binding protein
MTGFWLLGIPEGSRNAELALDLILWLTAQEQQKRMMLNAGVPATRLSVLYDQEIEQASSIVPELRTAMRAATPRPRTPHYVALEQICGEHIGDALRGSVSPEEALKIANRRMRDLLVREGDLGSA